MAFPRRWRWALVALVVLAAIAAGRIHWDYQVAIQSARESVLRENLRRTRLVLAQFANDYGQYPRDLHTLVAQKYLRALPMDPITGRNDTWLLVVVAAPDDPTRVGIQDIQSGARGASRDGRPYADW